MTVTYFGGKDEVQLGDRASIRLWFKTRTGRVVYVPGLSQMNAEFEFNGMRWVGIRLANGALVATPVLVKTNSLKKKVRLIARDSSPCEFITPDSKEFEERGEGAAL